MATTTVDLLDTLNLLSWDVLACGRERGWVTASDLSSFAIACLRSTVKDTELPAVAELASAEKLPAADVDRLLSQLSPVPSGPKCPALDCWRLAKLIELRSQDLDWEAKVTRLQEVAAEFGYPADMQECSRYSTGTRDPIEALESLIGNLRKQLGVD